MDDTQADPHAHDEVAGQPSRALSLELTGFAGAEGAGEAKRCSGARARILGYPGFSQIERQAAEQGENALRPSMHLFMYALDRNSSRHFPRVPP
jgi:hypothetical protein